MAIERVCSSCFGDVELRSWVRGHGGPRGCDACGKFDSPTCKLEDVCRYIETCLRRYWGSAVDQLPYESAEGGYIGTTWTTYELLREEVCIALPRDKSDGLFHSIIGSLTDETWCEYDWLTLDHDVALRSSWKRFCETVKHKRRFFFHADGTDDRDSFTPAALLESIARIGQTMGLIRELPLGTRMWKARPDIQKGTRVTAADFGPPPAHLALQSNRMNPPGIPMLYLASTGRTALVETRAEASRVGQWKSLRPIRILDLRDLPPNFGVFADVDRNLRLALRFFRSFAADIMTPVARDQRVHIDYLPSQVITEFVRDFSFDAGKVEGVAYGSTVHPKGWNVALFTSPVELGLALPNWGKAPAQAMRFERAVRLTSKSGALSGLEASGKKGAPPYVSDPLSGYGDFE
jgi:RES domain-containing protein